MEATVHTAKASAIMVTWDMAAMVLVWATEVINHCIGSAISKMANHNKMFSE